MADSEHGNGYCGWHRRRNLHARPVLETAHVRTQNIMRSFIVGFGMLMAIGAAVAAEDVTRYEAEDLRVIASHLCQTSRQIMTPWGEARWSKGAQLFCGSDQGGYVDLLLSVKKSGPYLIVLHATRAPDFGKVRVSVAGKPLGQVIDLYRPHVAPTGPIRLDTVRLEAGNVTLRFEVLGKHAASTGYRFGIDCLAYLAT